VTEYLASVVTHHKAAANQYQALVAHKTSQNIRELNVMEKSTPSSPKTELAISSTIAMPPVRFCSLLSMISYLSSYVKHKKATKVRDPKSFQGIADQSQSPLVQLPAELREMIWKEVFGQGTMHITHLESHLGHARCTDEATLIWCRHDCWGKGCCASYRRVEPSLYTGPISGVEKPQNLLDLVMSCRKV
jgi:hypothetical protein